MGMLRRESRVRNTKRRVMAREGTETSVTELRGEQTRRARMVAKLMTNSRSRKLVGAIRGH